MSKYSDIDIISFDYLPADGAKSAPDRPLLEFRERYLQ